jgi:hypothetical protein
MGFYDKLGGMIGKMTDNGAVLEMTDIYLRAHVPSLFKKVKRELCVEPPRA